MTALAQTHDAVRAATDDDAVHVVCCDEDMALCGDVLAGEFQPDTSETTCRLCAVAEAEDLPCGDPTCPLWGVS